MERRKVMTIAAVLISVMVAAGACGKMPQCRQKRPESHRETGRHRQTVLKKLRQVRQIRKRMKKKEQKNRVRRRHRPNQNRLLSTCRKCLF